MRLFSSSLALLASSALSVSAIQLDLNDPNSIKSVASEIAFGMMSYYNGNQSGQIPGTLPQPYYWWECGEMFGTMIDYWYYTGDATYNDVVSQGMLYQVGSGNDYMPSNQTKDEGNDDQIFWGFAAMTAAEYNFPNPPAGQPGWLALAQAVFNSQALRWDNSTCNGGLRWQIFTFNDGYNYKNSPSNAGYLNLASRLYAYTDNETYADWAESTWEWMEGVGLIGGDSHWTVYDGTNTPNNCTTLDRIQWTYSAGMLINAAAVMWSKTNSSTWYQRAQGVWDSSNVFFVDGKIMTESACESHNNCDTDQLSFKSTFSRFLAASTKVAPWLYDQIQPYLYASAQAAAEQCCGQPGGNACGSKWYMNSTWDGTTGVGQQMSALEVIAANLIQNSTAPLTGSTGGTSKGDPSAGSQQTPDPTMPTSKITTADKAGAGILTTLVLICTLGGTWWIIA